MRSFFTQLLRSNSQAKSSLRLAWEEVSGPETRSCFFVAVKSVDSSIASFNENSTVEVDIQCCYSMSYFSESGYLVSGGLADATDRGEARS